MGTEMSLCIPHPCYPRNNRQHHGMACPASLNYSVLSYLLSLYTSSSTFIFFCFLFSHSTLLHGPFCIRLCLQHDISSLLIVETPPLWKGKSCISILFLYNAKPLHDFNNSCPEVQLKSSIYICIHHGSNYISHTIAEISETSGGLGE